MAFGSKEGVFEITPLFKIGTMYPFKSLFPILSPIHFSKGLSRNNLLNGYMVPIYDWNQISNIHKNRAGAN